MVIKLYLAFTYRHSFQKLNITMKLTSLIRRQGQPQLGIAKTIESIGTLNTLQDENNTTSFRIEDNSKSYIHQISKSQDFDIHRLKQLYNPSKFNRSPAHHTPKQVNKSIDSIGNHILKPARMPDLSSYHRSNVESIENVERNEEEGSQSIQDGRGQIGEKEAQTGKKGRGSQFLKSQSEIEGYEQGQLYEEEPEGWNRKGKCFQEIMRMEQQQIMTLFEVASDKLDKLSQANTQLTVQNTNLHRQSQTRQQHLQTLQTQLTKLQNQHKTKTQQNNFSQQQLKQHLLQVQIQNYRKLKTVHKQKDKGKQNEFY